MATSRYSMFVANFLIHFIESKHAYSRLMLHGIHDSGAMSIEYLKGFSIHLVFLMSVIRISSCFVFLTSVFSAVYRKPPISIPHTSTPCRWVIPTTISRVGSTPFFCLVT